MQTMQKLQVQALPDDTQSRLATAIIWHRAGRLKEAAGMYRLLLEEAPENPDILHLLGLVGHQMGHSDFAVRQIIRAVDRNPGKATFHASLGQVFLALKDYGHAVMALSNAARLEPDNADHLANLGHALDAVGAPREAAATYAALVQLSPGLAEAWINLANALPTGPRKDSLHRLSLALNPAHAIGHYNAARAAFSSARHTEAVGLYRRALAIDPALAEAHGNLAMLLPNTASSGKLDFYAAALALEPAHSGIRTDAGLALLARGDLKRGWALHEARLAKKVLAEDRGTGLPRWQGESLAGKTILVWREQGIGDEILFASCLPDLIALAKGGRIFVECEARLAALFQRSFPEVTVILGTQLRDHVGQMDVQIPMGSLAMHFRRTLSDFPHHAGYLSADWQRRAGIARQISALPGELKIGLCWRSQMAGRQSLALSIEALAPLFRIPGISFVNLQYGACDTEIAAAEQALGIRLHRIDGLDLTDDLDGVAALIASLDLVITAGTSVGEMAGALGVHCWRLGRPYEWTLLGTQERPWFPSMRVFSAPAGQPMESLVPDIRLALSGFQRDCRSFRNGYRCA